MITIKEIAEMANVSTTTVSNVIHGKTAKMAPATRDRIARILKEQNYVTNMGARLIACNNSRLVGVIINNPSTEDKNALQDPYVSELFGAMEREIRQQGYYMLTYIAEQEQSLTGHLDNIVKTAQSWKIDGLVILGVDSEESDFLLDALDIPIVFIDCFSSSPDCLNVGIEDERGGYLVTKHLLENGHRKICFLADRKDPIDVDAARLEGHRRALREYGLPFSYQDIFPIPRDREHRHEAFELLYKRLYRYTALFFASDYYAADAMRFFQKKGMRIPDDISITGFDDNYFSQLVTPSITTVRQNITLKGQVAVRKLISIIEGKVPEEYRTILPVELIPRDSVKKIGPCPKKREHHS